MWKSSDETMRDDEIAGHKERYDVQLVIGDQQLPGEKSFKCDQEKGVPYGKRQRHLSLYRAAMEGDWYNAKKIFEEHPEDIVARISKVGDTPLHIAAAANRPDFVTQLVTKYMTKDYLETTNYEGKTAFCNAAASGNIDLVKLMLEKNQDLAQTRGQDDMLPIQMAALLCHEDVVLHLYQHNKDKGYMTNKDLINLLVALINNYLFDAALQLVNDHTKLAATSRVGDEEDGETALHALARKPLTSSDSANPNQQSFLKNVFNLFSGANMLHYKRMDPKALEIVEILWKNLVILLDDQQISRLINLPFRLIFVAAEHGNDQFLSKLIYGYPDFIFKVNDDGYTIFHIAVRYRHERIFNLLHQTGSIKDLIVVIEDEQRNNILHLAAKLPPPNRLNVVSGAALQLQRELLWFKEVNEVVPPLYAESKNSDGKTARALFSEEHAELLKSGEEWMKTTAESCMVVAALIATVVFAAAFTVPGGVKEDTGSPNFLKKAAFVTFSISDTISLVCSSCSILTFLSILTARYAEEDFLWSLPTKLVLGISTLFISIATMMVVFCLTLFILFNEGMQELAILATAMASIPVFLFLWQQYRLLLDVVRSTYLSNTLFQHTKQTHILQDEGN